MVCEDLGEAEVAIVNTCAFSAEAEREPAGIIRRLEGLKSQGLIGRIGVAGCLPDRRGSRVGGRFPGVDRVIRQADIPHVAAIVRTWPAAFDVGTPTALGFLRDADADAIVDQYDQAQRMSSGDSNGLT